MKRSTFLKYLGVGVTAPLVVGKMLADVGPEEVVVNPITELPPSVKHYPIAGDGWMAQMEARNDVIAYCDRKGIEEFHKAMNEMYKHRKFHK